MKLTEWLWSHAFGVAAGAPPVDANLRPDPTAVWDNPNDDDEILEDYADDEVEDD